jgi:hypothetical protein
VKKSFRPKLIVIRNSKKKQTRFSQCKGKLNTLNSVNQVWRKDLRKRIKNWQGLKQKYLSMKNKRLEWLLNRRSSRGWGRMSISIRFNN